jgi:hypothetical protein
MDDRRHHVVRELRRSSYSIDELLYLTAERRSRLIEKATILKRHLQQLAAELTACEGCIDELDRTERHLMRENWHDSNARSWCVDSD